MTHGGGARGRNQIGGSQTPHRFRPSHLPVLVHQQRTAGQGNDRRQAQPAAKTGAAGSDFQAHLGQPHRKRIPQPGGL